jgi:hypothetical protein
MSHRLVTRLQATSNFRPEEAFEPKREHPSEGDLRANVEDDERWTLSLVSIRIHNLQLA